eukprot:268911-Amphidinium_carterae.1
MSTNTQNWAEALAAVQKEGRALAGLYNHLKADPAIVLAAVEQDGSSLGFATKALRGDHAIVLAAVQQA